ncbi:sulfite reductase (NADPH) alpha subunit [Mannheimia varigena USDA-ARS-USMARC-1296]|uniref:Sulfite reductase (NADPH) alpha subunit n=1 Tax=Mannheimia varigena USDA-ARS-USMARC-1296 TaxID=1433287 RepID=W0QE57_9PAST|nr:sulfite reductase flavoprotein subunit alpha [Mannheimia varigena]AHG76562.1 sulfite reductase (NADPH) alpha subunit [Mannheimia varigena USDA-ARS-USMARC-1296]
MSLITHIHIAYGSESGNTEKLAHQLAQQSFLNHYSTSLSTLNETDLTAFNPNTLLLILTSSFGDGEPPENADEFAEKLENLTACNVKYAIFGLGDITYNKFCGYSKQLACLLQAKQAQAIIERVDADLNYQEIFKQWLPLVEQALAQPNEFPIPHQLSVQAYGEESTYQAEVIEIKHLAQSEPAVYHLRLSLKESGIFYQAGDLIYVKVTQPDSLLSEYANWFNDTNAIEQLRHKELRLLSKNVLRDVQKICGSAELKDLTKISNKKALEQYLYGHDLLDVLRDFDPNKTVTLADLDTILSNLSARAYSISSCGKTHPDYVDLCIRHVYYQLDGRDYQGTASDYLAKLQAGDFVSIFVKANPNFRLPEDLTAPVVMIGSGTGIAPHIAFLQALGSQYSNIESYLFFGERYREKDFLYQNELERYLANGVLTQLFTAFSRDQAEKFYVQGSLAEQAELIWTLIKKGAYFYICGSKAMSKAVDAKLIKIADQIGGEAYIDDFNNVIARLVAEGRLMRDVY